MADTRRGHPSLKGGGEAGEEARARAPILMLTLRPQGVERGLMVEVLAAGLCSHGTPRDLDRGALPSSPGPSSWSRRPQRRFRDA